MRSTRLIRSSHVVTRKVTGRCPESTRSEGSFPTYPAGNPCHNHETGIASIAAGAEFGVARSATIRSVRFNDCDLSAGHGDIIAAIDWVTANHVKPAVMNLSWGLPWLIDGILGGSVHHASKAARQAGVFVVVSAGNDNSDACGQSPANAAELMVVGATDANDSRASFSNYGSCVDIFAPGAVVDVANYLVVPPFITANGTSYSAPYVAGVAAVLYGTYPNDTPDQIHYSIRDGGTAGVISNPGANSPNLLLYSQLPAPVQVSIQGPTYAGPFSECTWNAEVRAGRGPFQFQWSGLLTGSGSGISGLISQSGGLQVQVSDALSGSANATVGVTFDPNYAGFTCQ